MNIKTMTMSALAATCPLLAADIGTSAQAPLPLPSSAPLAKPGFFDSVKSTLDSFMAGFFNLAVMGRVFQVFLTILAGLLVVGVVLALVRRLTKNRLDPRTSALFIKVVQYTGLALIVINAFNVAKVDLSALLGAAGIAGIAIGFAAQTSISNFISGFFLVSEKTFTVGDVLIVDGITGEVFSIDALSVKLRTFDNKLVRIANETLIKATVMNLTRFPVRRMDIRLTVTYETRIDLLRAMLLEVALSQPTVLRKPEPFFMVESFGKDGMGVMVGVWFEQVDWEPTNIGMHRGIKERLEREGINFAHQTVQLLK